MAAGGSVQAVVKREAGLLGRLRNPPHHQAIEEASGTARIVEMARLRGSKLPGRGLQFKGRAGGVG